VLHLCCYFVISILNIFCPNVIVKLSPCSGMRRERDDHRDGGDDDDEEG
jgi:hypothetical protein